MTELRDQVINGELKGTTFLTEGEIAARYGVSKAPAKAALQALTQEGYLICYPRRGYMASSISAEEYELIRELRAHIEKLSVSLAIERASDTEIESLRMFVVGLTNELNPYKTNNTKFHLRLAEISHNPYIGEVLLKLLSQTSRYAFMKRIDDSSHAELIDALLARDRDKAFACMDKDLNP